jgi:hypothetical protein
MPSAATVGDNRGERAVFTDGPFVDSKEFLAGSWIIEAGYHAYQATRADLLRRTGPQPGFACGLRQSNRASRQYRRGSYLARRRDQLR